MAVTKTIYEIEKRQNYSKKITIAKGKKADCYSKKQMKSIYPKGDYKIIAERVKESKKEPTSIMTDGTDEFPIYKDGTYSKFIYSKKGFLAIKNQPDGFVAVLKNKLPIYFIILLLIAALVCGGFYAYDAFHPDEPTSSTVSKDKKIDDNDVALKDKVPTTKSYTANIDGNAVALGGNKATTGSSGAGTQEGIRIPGYKSMTVAANTKNVTVCLENPAQNNCYFVMRIVLLDTGKTLYESKMVSPGKGIYNITLTRALNAGTYKAQLQYEPYDMKALTRLNGAVVNFDLIAE